MNHKKATHGRKWVAQTVDKLGAGIIPAPFFL